MSSTDLFSFLDDSKPRDEDEEESEVEKEEEGEEVELTRKRKAGDKEPSPPTIDDPQSKKIKIDSEETITKPVVVDDFSTEAKREVPVLSSDLLDDKQKQISVTTESLFSKITLSHLVRHQVAVPPSYPYIPISSHVPPAVPAKSYPFTLDPFQQVAIHAIQRDESVLVSAHTSAGKTVVAEYAIAQCLQQKQRVVYTSPIKALSNQKYRELLAEFGDVGLMTGDVTINPSATCLVMTTEILRSMLYRGSSFTHELHIAIFDEIHYMRDPARGVIWEETILLLPPQTTLLFLSATIPNSLQFAEWITSVKNRPTHVVYTTFRPTPLQHYLFPSGGEGIYLVMNEKGEWREDNFVKGVGVLVDRNNITAGEDPADPKSGSSVKGKKGKSRKGGAGGTKGPSDISKIIRMLILKSYNPVICFAFSKRECEALALSLSSSSKSLTLTTAEEQDLITTIFTNALSTLSQSDKLLPQITSLLPLLKNGIGIHHSGLLPLLKEIIEILFQESLIKILFATETFSIGLNMPAKTVVFTGLRKFDGSKMRVLGSGEYIQMSGRAGRRGLDERGVVVMMVDERVLEECGGVNGSDTTQSFAKTIKAMVSGASDPLNSAFRLGWNMLLNLMRVEGVSPEWVMERSFFTWQRRGDGPKLEEELKKTQLLLDNVTSQFSLIPSSSSSSSSSSSPNPKSDSDSNSKLKESSTSSSFETLISEYYSIRRQLDILASDFREIITHPSYALPFLQVGRLVRVVVRKKVRRSRNPNPTDVDVGGEDDEDDDDDEDAEEEEEDWGWGVLVNWTKRSSSSTSSIGGKKKKKKKKRRNNNSLMDDADGPGDGGEGEEMSPHEQYILDVLLNVIPSSSTSSKGGSGGKGDIGGVKPCPFPYSSTSSNSNSSSTPTTTIAKSSSSSISSTTTSASEPQILPLLLTSLAGISHLRIFLPKDLRPLSARQTAWKSVLEVNKRFPEGIALLDPVKNMGVKDKKFQVLIDKITTLENNLLTHPLHTSPHLSHLYTLHLQKTHLLSRIRRLKHSLSSNASILHLSELKSRKRVLRRLGFITKDDVVDVKGRVACEISSGDEVLLTEMVFAGVWNALSPEVCAAVLSCFVFGEKSEQPTKLTDELAAPLRSLQELAHRIAKVCKESKIDIDEKEYVQSFKVELMDAVLKWCRGASFLDICKLTDQFEGSIIRVFRRLQELIRQMTQAAKVIGNKELEEKFEKASEMLERPNSIIFAASLYL